METLRDHSQLKSKESYSSSVSKLQQLKISHEQTGSCSDGEELKKVHSGPPSHRFVRAASVTLTAAAKTPKPPTVPKSRSFYQKSYRALEKSDRLGGDGEACEDVTEEDAIDYCGIERLPGDGCFSESTDDDELSNISDGFDENEDTLDDLDNDVNEETCNEGMIYRVQLNNLAQSDTVYAPSESVKYLKVAQCVLGSFAL